MGPGDCIEIQRLVDLPSRRSSTAEQRTQPTQFAVCSRPAGSLRPLGYPRGLSLHAALLATNLFPNLFILMFTMVVDLHLQCPCLYGGQGFRHCPPHLLPPSTFPPSAHLRKHATKSSISCRRSAATPPLVTPLLLTPAATCLHLPPLAGRQITTHPPMIPRVVSGLESNSELVPHRLGLMDHHNPVLKLVH
ncbi:hypothetical protein E2C01_008059 [Portunus trituberculatus]|uniref:Uncharacterized protein n=1 Tax=Portunus trituberculatus TaxID=210409 RepID=A0A5B7D543_PORTR|nr:hypothetical protein [Portunus trituberculatus]